jgi:hypothetical protein
MAKPGAITSLYREEKEDSRIVYLSVTLLGQR